MFSWLLPKEAFFFDFFSQHAALIALAAEEFCAEQDLQKIEQFEQQADKVFHACTEALRTTFITPIDRHDIFRLSTRMDDIIDNIHAAARALALYKLKTKPAAFNQLSQILLQAVQALQSAVDGLHNLKKAAPILDSCIAINTLENEADTFLAETLAALVDHEQDLKLIFKWREVYAFVEKAIDRCEEAANIIQGIILEHV